MHFGTVRLRVHSLFCLQVHTMSVVLCAFVVWIASWDISVTHTVLASSHLLCQHKFDGSSRSTPGPFSGTQVWSLVSKDTPLFVAALALLARSCSLWWPRPFPSGVDPGWLRCLPRSLFADLNLRAGFFGSMFATSSVVFFAYAKTSFSIASEFDGSWVWLGPWVALLRVWLGPCWPGQR